MSGYQQLKVWQKAHLLTLKIYKISKYFPDEEKYGLTSQMRRAVVSVELNIAEGKSRQTDKEFRHFLYISRGSNQEVHCLLKICLDLELIKKDEFQRVTEQCEEVNKMLNGLINKVN